MIRPRRSIVVIDVIVVVLAAVAAVAIVKIWWTVGFNILLFIAGLKSINPEIYEASDLDGANSWAKFRYITWPLIWPITALVLVK